MTRFIFAALAVAGFMAGAASARADFVVDTFQEPTAAAPYQISLLNGVGPYTRVDPLGNGLSRTLTVGVLSPNPPLFDSATGSNGGGLFRLNAESASTVVANLTYTGLGSSLSGGQSVKLSFERWDSGNTFTTAPIRLAVNTASGTLTYDTMVSDSGTPFDLTIPVSAFAGSGDLSNVSSLSLDLNGPAGSREATDIRVTGISVQQVPAPAGVIGLLAAAPLLALARRRLRRAKA